MPSIIEPLDFVGGWIGANYIPAALRLMHALHLLRWNEDMDGFATTKEGANFVQDSLKRDAAK